MISARITAELPEETWIAAVSKQTPDATFRLLSGVRTGGTAIELGEATGDDPAAISAAIESHDAITAYDRLECTEDTLLAKYETTDTGLYEAVAASALPLEYPVVVRNGWYELDITGTRTELDRFRDQLDAADREYELVSLVHDLDTRALLTERQHELLAAALREGYYRVPRTCTLAELAASLDLDKSTASRILRRGEARLVKHALTTA